MELLEISVTVAIILSLEATEWAPVSTYLRPQDTPSLF